MTRLGDWAEDFEHENGQYDCVCAMCGSHFTGHKRRAVCKVCAIEPKPTPKVIELTPEEHEKFSLYLHERAELANGMAEQLAELPNPTTDIMVKKLQTEAIALAFVASLLLQWEPDDVPG